MSRMLDEIKFQLTGREFVKRQKLAHVDLKITAESSEIYCYKKLEYKVYAEFGMMVVCEPKDIEDATKSVYASLKHEIYGHLVGKVRELELALYDWDEDHARMLMRDILREVD